MPTETEGGTPGDPLRASRVYDELHRLAAAMFRGQPADHTLQATALVHEAWLRLAARAEPYESRAHFFGVAARAMRHVLVDHARRVEAAKRGGGVERVTLVTGDGAVDGGSTDVLELDDALRRLESGQPRLARVVELRFFGGLSIDETAEALGVSHMTVSSDWRKARVWLARELS